MNLLSNVKAGRVKRDTVWEPTGLGTVWLTAIKVALH